MRRPRIGCIFESNAIARHVARMRRDTELLGVSFFESGQVDAWMDFVSHDLEVSLTLWLYPVLGFLDFHKDVHQEAVGDVRRALNILESHLVTRTYLVGEKITLADITAVSVLYYGMKFLFAPVFLKDFPSVQRWFITCVNQPQFVVRWFDAVALPLTPPLNSRGAHVCVCACVCLCVCVCVCVRRCPRLCWAASTRAPKRWWLTAPRRRRAPRLLPVPALVPPLVARRARASRSRSRSRRVASKRAARRLPLPLTPLPPPAPAPAPAKKEKKAGPFDGLAKSSMDGDEWKRTYSNSRPNYYAAMDWFWANLDTEGWSLWRCTYNYNSENKVAFMTSNLVGGYLQRCDEIRKFAFGSMVIVEGETYDVSGVWLIRGQSIQPMLDCNPDAEYYTWTKIENHGEDATRKMVGDYWCADEKLGDATLYDSKLFK